MKSCHPARQVEPAVPPGQHDGRPARAMSILVVRRWMPACCQAEGLAQLTSVPKRQVNGATETRRNQADDAGSRGELLDAGW